MAKRLESNTGVEYQDTGLAGFFSKYWPSLVAVFFCSILIAAMVYLMATVQNKTPLSDSLITFILTAASCVISYIVSKIFAEQSYTREMRDHGVQIARGLMELKRQIGDLTNWTIEKRSLLSRSKQWDPGCEASLEHVELTLQNFVGLADNAVGGIAGVIGAAYIQYEDFIGEVGRIRNEGLLKASEIEKEMQTAPAAELQKLQEQVEKIATNTEQRISTLAKAVALPVPPAPVKRAFATSCPMCSAVYTVEMVDRPGETRPMRCDKCYTTFNAHISATRQVFTRIVGTPAAAQTSALTRANWANDANIRDEATTILRKTSAFLDPAQLTSLAGMAIKHDRYLRNSGKDPTPHLLMVSMLTDCDIGTTRTTAIRNFVKLMMLGGGFEGAKTFASPYKNELSEPQMLKAIASGAIHRLSMLRPIFGKHAAELTLLIFGKLDSDTQKVVADVIAELPSAPPESA